MLSILFFGCASICSKLCCAGCFHSNFIPWILIRILAKPFCKEWHQLWGVTQHCCDALCSYLSGPHLPHHDDILSILTRIGPTSIRNANLPLYSIQVSAFTCEWVRECERLWKAVGHPGRRWHCDAEWSPPIFSANSPKDINVGTSSFQASGAFKNWQNAWASRYSTSEHHRFYPQDMSRGQTISSWDDWNRVTIMTSCFHCIPMFNACCNNS